MAPTHVPDGEPDPRDPGPQPTGPASTGRVPDGEGNDPRNPGPQPAPEADQTPSYDDPSKQGSA